MINHKGKKKKKMTQLANYIHFQKMSAIIGLMEY